MPKLAEDQPFGPSNAQRRLRGLLKANRLVVEHLDLPTVLHQLVVASVDLVGAAYGAIAILGPDGKLAQLIHEGLDAEAMAGIGQPPEGLELLAALIADPTPPGLASLGGDVRSVGSLPGQPVMNSVLGVPLRVRDEVFGHLYLADPRVDAFSDDDRELVQALASTAGVAIAHARLFEESARRQLWTAASTKVTQELLTNDEVDALQLVAEQVLELSEADLVAVILSDAAVEHEGDELVVKRAVGKLAESVIDVVLPHGDTMIRRCLKTQRPQMLADFGASTGATRLPRAALGPAMAVPLHTGDGVRGTLFVMRNAGASLFTEFDLDVAASFAGQAALALERSDARGARVRTRTLEDRDRIARDLHDHVIQRLFATGLSIQTVCGLLGPGPITDRLDLQIDEIDATIRQIRSTIFGLHMSGDNSASVRAQILQVIESVKVLLPCSPDVDFRGPVDILVPVGLYGDLVAVVREALTNVGRHASARHVQVIVTADPSSLRIEVLDDGRGIGEVRNRSGLHNLRGRAAALGGSFEAASRAGPGTHLTWTVPLTAAS
jgi:signal transduction histidine kinase